MARRCVSDAADTRRRRARPHRSKRRAEQSRRRTASRRDRSRKASELGPGAHAALTFWWPQLERSVRVEGAAPRGAQTSCVPGVERAPRRNRSRTWVRAGAVARVSAAETASYFLSRPRASRLGAWASRQSSVVASEDVLSEREQTLDARFGDDVPVPDFWGGYRLSPRRVEFWQGRASRLHDRVLFSRDDDVDDDDDDASWTRERLAP